MRQYGWLLGLLLGLFALQAEADEGDGARLYLGATAVQLSNGNTGEGMTLGYQTTTGGKKVGGIWGIELLGIANPNGGGALPIFTLDGGLRFTPWPEAGVVPYATLGMGVSFLIIVPFPGVAASTGVLIPVGEELKLDLGFGLRQVVNIYGAGQESLGAATLSAGLAF